MHLLELIGEPLLQPTDHSSVEKALAAILLAGYTVTAVLLHVSAEDALVFAVGVVGDLLGFVVFPVVGEAKIVMTSVVVTG